MAPKILQSGIPDTAIQTAAFQALALPSCTAKPNRSTGKRISTHFYVVRWLFSYKLMPASYVPLGTLFLSAHSYDL